MKLIPTVIQRRQPQALRAALVAALALAAGLFCFKQTAVPAVEAQQAQVTVVNAASFSADRRVAPDSLAAAFGAFVTQNNQSYSAPAGVLPLPTTLGGVQVRINGVNAGLLFVGTQQINFLVPPALADAPSATVQVTNSDNSTRTGTVTVQRAAPGVFSAAATGQGVVIGLTTFDGVNFQLVFNTATNPPSERDVDAGTTARKNILVLFGTGFKLVGTQNITMTLQGVPMRVQFAGGVAGLAGLDQINVELPPEAAGLGSVDLQVNARIPNDTALQRSNKTTIKMGGQLPPVRVNPITPDAPIDGDLNQDDQIQQLSDGSKRTYFFDAYRFTTTQANTTVAIDLRARTGSPLDAAVILYRVNNGQLVLFGEDDQSGGYGNGRIENNNALYMAVLSTVGDYVIFASSANEQPNGTGAYTLRLRQNVITQTSYGANLNSSIVNTDVQTSAGTYLKPYWFTAAANDNVDIRMNSTVFFPGVILQANEGGVPIASDPNPNLLPNARIVRNLGTPGVYVVLATPYEPNKLGAFTFTLNRVASADDETPATSTMPQRAPGGRARASMDGRTKFLPLPMTLAFFFSFLPSESLAAGSLVSILLSGFVVGVLHALDADHLAAVSAIVSERRSLLSSSLVGGWWGLGHTVSLLLAGVAVILLQVQISPRLEQTLEFGVALMLIGLGANVLYKLYRGGKLHAHVHTHGARAHIHPHVHTPNQTAEAQTHHGFKLGARPLLIGMAHGLAGSAGLFLLGVAAIQSVAGKFAYIAVFGLGSIGGMMLMSSLLSLPAYLTAARYARAYRAVRLLAGCFSFGCGLWLAYEIGGELLR